MTELIIMLMALVPLVANYCFTGNVVLVNGVVTIVTAAIAVIEGGWFIVNVGRFLLDEEEL